MRREIEEYMAGLRELFFPRFCAVCGRPLEWDEKDFCIECFSDIPLTYFWDWEDNSLRRRLEEKCSVEYGVSLFHFSLESPYHYLMHRIKFEGGKNLGYRLGYLLGLYMKDGAGFGPMDIVVPVPLHPLRRFRRGYNQSQIIAAGIAAALGISVCPNLLKRTRWTRPQSGISGGGKSRNVEGAFRIDDVQAEKLKDGGFRHILLVDDTITTGSTISECVKVLTPFFKVSVASLAFVG